MAGLFQLFTNSIKNLFIEKQNIDTNNVNKSKLPIEQENINKNLIFSPHFIIDRIIDSNIRIGIGSLYKNGEAIEILNFTPLHI
jgi:hypothetical protein